MVDKNNKGEWTELLVFIKLLAEQKLNLSDVDLSPKKDFFSVNKVTTHNLELDFLVINQSTIKVINKKNGDSEIIDISKIINKNILKDLASRIINGKGASFAIPEFEVIQKGLGFNVVKGGNSSQKADIILDIANDEFKKQNEGFGIKSYLGDKPTLLNASGKTNFIFRIDGMDHALIDEINGIKTRTKLKDRIEFIEKSGGSFKYVGAEKETMNYNLKMVDSLMPEIVGYLLLGYYVKRISSLDKIIDDIHKNGILNNEINYGDKQSLVVKVKKLLIDILLGFFAGKKWDGEFSSNGTIVMKKVGDMVGFHIVDAKSLKDYLFNNMKMETGSSTKHRFGKLYKEKDGNLYFKLNFQLRFK